MTRDSPAIIGMALAKSKSIAYADALQAIRDLSAESVTNGMSMAVAQPDTYSGPIRYMMMPATLKAGKSLMPYPAGLLRRGLFCWESLVQPLNEIAFCFELPLQVDQQR